LWSLPALGVALALCAGGCSLSHQLDSNFARSHDADDEVTTGSIGGSTTRQQHPAAVSQERDLAAARRAVTEALSKGSRDTSVPWEDPTTGARGTVTPSSAYTQDGTTCRDFLASYVRNGSESWLQGEACRSFQGRWEVRQMRPWRRT
jgi:surface antigen